MACLDTCPVPGIRAEASMRLHKHHPGLQHGSPCICAEETAGEGHCLHSHRSTQVRPQDPMPVGPSYLALPLICAHSQVPISSHYSLLQPLTYAYSEMVK